MYAGSPSLTLSSASRLWSVREDVLYEPRGFGVRNTAEPSDAALAEGREAAATLPRLALARPGPLVEDFAPMAEEAPGWADLVMARATDIPAERGAEAPRPVFRLVIALP